MTTHLTNKIANDLYLIGELQARSADQLPERKFHEQTFTHTYICPFRKKKRKVLVLVVLLLVGSWLREELLLVAAAQRRELLSLFSRAAAGARAGGPRATYTRRRSVPSLPSPDLALAGSYASSAYPIAPTAAAGKTLNSYCSVG